MKIKDVVHVRGLTGYFNQDLAAIRNGARSDGFFHTTRPISPGFQKIVQPGQSVLLMLIMSDGQVALGDGMDVIYSGVAGRDPLFRVEEFEEFLTHDLPSLLRGRSLNAFRPLAELVERSEYKGRPLHTALRYGISQALLNACALAQRMPAALVIAREYDCVPSRKPIPILVSSVPGDQLDSRILRNVQLLPHSSFSNLDDVGSNGEKLLSHIAYLVHRIKKVGESGYRPTLHVDLYGTLGELCNYEASSIVTVLERIKQEADEFPILVESPVIMETRAGQIAMYRELSRLKAESRVEAPLIVDEWCNTLQDVKDFTDAKAADYLQVKMPDLGGVNNSIEAVLYATRRGIGISLGGSINETDISARVSAHVALACQPSFMFAKPGAGGDEGLMIETNEMLRTLALLNASEQSWID